MVNSLGHLGRCIPQLLVVVVVCPEMRLELSQFAVGTGTFQALKPRLQTI